MKLSEDSSVVLVENPLTGNDSFATALKLKHVGNVDKWAVPTAIRKEWGDWDKAQKIVLVRDPRERFESGVTLAFLLAETPDESIEQPEEFVNHIRSLLGEDTNAEQRALAVLEYMKSGKDVPAYLRPQREWLSAKFDIVLATHNIAEFFNVKDDLSCCIRSNQLVSRFPAARGYAGGEKTRALFNEAFADDIEFLNRVVLWSPDADKVRLLSGYCRECANKKKREGDSEVELIDLSASESDSNEDDSHTSANDDKPKSQRKRTRKQVDKGESES